MTTDGTLLLSSKFHEILPNLESNKIFYIVHSKLQKIVKNLQKTGKQKNNFYYNKIYLQNFKVNFAYYPILDRFSL